MTHSFLLLTTATILSMAAPSYNAISFPQICTLELTRPYCNAKDNSNVFPHDVFPLQSSTPIELPPDTLDCKASAISDDVGNMYFVHGTAAESSLNTAHGRSLKPEHCLILIVVVIMKIALIAFYFKIISMRDERLRRKPIYVVADELVVAIRVRVDKDFVKPNVAIEMYLLKEAFEELERHPEIYEDPTLYDFASEFMLETIKRAVFMKIPADKKVVWLKNRYISNKLFATSLDIFC